MLPPRRNLAAPDGRPVDQVVVDERRHVHELDGCSPGTGVRPFSGDDRNASVGRRRLPPEASASREIRPTRAWMLGDGLEQVLLDSSR